MNQVLPTSYPQVNTFLEKNVGVFKYLGVSEKRRKPTTNPLGKGKRNMSVNISQELRDQLGELAKRSGKKIGEYCRAILEEAATRSLIVRQSVKIESLAESSPPYGSSLTEPTQAADARAVSGAAELALKARGLKPQADAPSGETASPSSGAQKHPNPRPKPPTPVPK